MIPINESGTDSFVADSTAGIGANLRCVIGSNGKISPAGATTIETGVTKVATIDAVRPTEVRLANAPGSVAVIATEAIDPGAIAYRAAGGKVASSGSSAYGRVGKEAAEADLPVTIYPF